MTIASASAFRSAASSALARSLSITASIPTRRRPGRNRLVRVHDRDPAASGADHDRAGLEQDLDRLQSEDPLRKRRRNDAPHALAVGLERPALLRGQLVGLRGGVDRPDRLRRIAERGVVRVDLDLGEERREALLERQRRCRAPAGSGSRSSHRSARRAGRAGTRATSLYAAPWSASRPTCGPFPCETTSSCSSATGASASHAARAFARWFSAVSGSPRRSKAFPPRATTTLTLSSQASGHGVILHCATSAEHHPVRAIRVFTPRRLREWSTQPASPPSRP